MGELSASQTPGPLLRLHMTALRRVGPHKLPWSLVMAPPGLCHALTPASLDSPSFSAHKTLGHPHGHPFFSHSAMLRTSCHPIKLPGRLIRKRPTSSTCPTTGCASLTSWAGTPSRCGPLARMVGEMTPASGPWPLATHCRHCSATRCDILLYQHAHVPHCCYPRPPAHGPGQHAEGGAALAGLGLPLLE